MEFCLLYIYICDLSCCSDFRCEGNVGKDKAGKGGGAVR
jgi:hypothetical protein